VTAEYSARIPNSQCFVTSDEAIYDGDRTDNPIFGGGGFIGSKTLQECADACDTRSDEPGRPCVAFEWSDYGNNPASNARRQCALAWGCSSTSGWGGGSVFMREMPTMPPSGVSGDPHFRTWAGENFDFQGVCDLILVSNPSFGNGFGLDVHIRTKKTRSWSYVDSVAVRIGDDILEVTGGKKSNFWINSIQGNSDADGLVISKYPIKYEQLETNSNKFIVDLGDDEAIILKTWNSFMSVNFANPKHKNYVGSIGLMGNFPQGLMIGRDNTIIEDFNVFGQEWQVLSTEQNLFHDIEGPQNPLQCEIPSSVEMRRRLLTSLVTVEAAEKACIGVNSEDKELCIFDVMATNNQSSAGAY